ncbi:cytosine deaminase [Streptacidiphilus sp. MAP12-16]|uniref:hydrolase n=1 Tax=Streptacidiphilus sp. MAP12-16 TaxID=3156300 RepID=UPI0035168FF1
MPADALQGGQTVPGGPPLLLSGARLPDGRVVDVRISGERIEAVGTAGSLTAPERLDLTGYLLLPAPVEAHAHLDEAFTATPGCAPAGTGGNGGGRRCLESLQRRITEAALCGLGYGATVQRTHVRVGGGHGLTAVTAALQAARALHGLMELQVVALPGLLAGVAGADGRAVLRESLAMGAHAVGGRPDLDPDPDGHVAAVVALAEEWRRPVDLHTQAADPVRLARLASALGPLRPGAVIGPCAALGLMPPEVAGRSVELLASAGVFVVALPQSWACVGAGACVGVGVGLGAEVGTGAGVRAVGGSQSPPGAGRTAWPVPVRLLRTGGVRIAAGSGALRDAANPVGRVDPLEAAFLLAASGELDQTAAYETVSGTARAALGLPAVQVAAGFPADILAVRGDCLRGVLSAGHSRVVLRGGRVVSRTSAVREFAEATVPAVPRQGRSGPLCPD